MNDVTSDSASCFYVVSSSLILLRDFSAKVAKNFWEIRKKIGLIAPSFHPIVPFTILIRKSPSEVLEHQKISERNVALHDWLRVTEARRVNRFTGPARFFTRSLYKSREGVSTRFLRQSTSKIERIPLKGLSAWRSVR